MRRLLRPAFAMLALVAAVLPARADFIMNFPQWRMLGPDGQAAYAMAIFDVMTVINAGDKYTAARAMGLRACGIGLKMNGAMVAQVINKFYVDHPDQLTATPFVAFNGYVERGACSPFINRVRKEMGLNLMKEPPAPEGGWQVQQ